jgi:hypothetical protein
LKFGYAPLGAALLATVLLDSCAGGSKTASPNWTFVLGQNSASSRAPTDLGVLTSLGSLSPGQVVPSVNILAVSQNGFNGSVALADVPSTAAGHIAAVPSVSPVSPTPAGSPFTVGFTVPATYSTATSGIAFQGTDSQGLVKIAHIAFTVATVSGSFAPQTFKQSDDADSGLLYLTAVGGLSGAISVSFDTNILPTDGARKGDLELPKAVTVTAPSTPVTLGASPVSTPIDFTWSAWSTGNYAVIAVLRKAGTAIAVRAPLEITIGTGSAINGLPAVSTWQYGNGRQGANAFETALATSNVNSTLFGKLFTQPLDAKTEGQPLYLPNVSINGATHNVVFVATTNNSVYAFDADTTTGSNSKPLWKVSFGTAPPPGSEDGGNEPLDGILGTPVIQFNEGDYSAGATTTGVIYVCSKTISGGQYAYTLHGLDITSGAETAGGPVTVQASVQGKQSTVTLDVRNSYQRPALLLNGSELYLAIGGQYGDPQPDRGWLFGYNASNLQQQLNVFTTAPDLPDGSSSQIGASIWMSGAGPSSDGTNIYVTTGNGDFDATSGGSDHGDSILKLNSNLQVVDYFTPSDEQTLEAADLDLGSGGPVLIPSQAGSPPLILQVCKTNEVYLANMNSLGGFNASGDKIYQELAIGTNQPYRCSPAYSNGMVYMARGTSLQAFSIKSGMLASGAIATAPTSFSGYLPTPVISYSGNLPPIVWAIEQSSSNAILHAYAASSLKELYNSNTARDSAGTFAKFAVPTIISGKVYVPCGNELAVYGLLTDKGVKPRPRFTTKKR